MKNLFMAGVLISLTGCATAPQVQALPTSYLCSGFCYYQSKKNGLAREGLEVKSPECDLAWDQLYQKCDSMGVKRGEHELQKSLATKENAGDNFTVATKENSCALGTR